MNRTFDYLLNKDVLITGASSGIGLELARNLHGSGLRVTGVARDFSKVPDVPFKEIEVDLSDSELLPSRLKELPADTSVLVLNAGYGQFGGLEQFSYEQITRLVNTNLVANLMLVKHYLPIMKAAGGGDIVMVGSESALQGARAGSVYCATKFALRGFAQSLRADCSNSNIRVSLVNPGPVDSEFFDGLNFKPVDSKEFSLATKDVAETICHVLDQPRHVVTEEINVQPMKRSFTKK